MRPLMLIIALASAGAAAQTDTCGPSTPLSQRRLVRQLFLDLLDRVPSPEEYAEVEAKGGVSEALVRDLLEREEFYGRMKRYHRALLRSNVSSTVYDNGFTRVGQGTLGARVLQRNTISGATLRGQFGQGCDAFIEQSACNTQRQDPHAEPATKQCFDADGIPLPVSYDYDGTVYRCTALTGVADCAAALTAGRFPAKHLFYCDMRRNAFNGALTPFLCLPDPTKPATAALTREVLDGSGRVVAFENPAPLPTDPFARLDRCTLTMVSPVRGQYQPVRGCVQREGWAQVPAPFWFPAGSPPVNTCAIDAQTRAVNPGTGESCETDRFQNDRSCGCGARFKRCADGAGTVHDARVAAVNEEPLRIADAVLRSGEDYFHLLTTRRSSVNGPLSSLFHETAAPTVFPTSPPADLEVLPKLEFSQGSTWQSYLRGPQHSGVLTTQSFLLRYPTQRARVNAFYEAFLCKSFAPPADATLPAADDTCNRESNLARRCGCKYCHATLEPIGAHWGRFGERNSIWLDPVKFPRFDPSCRECGLSTGQYFWCPQCINYVIQAYDGDGANDLGLLRTYLYRTPEEEPNIEGGPRLLVERTLQTGDLERCTVRRLWKELLGRPMTVEEERLHLQPLADAFIDSGHKLKVLIERIVMSDAYRRVD